MYITNVVEVIDILSQSKFFNLTPYRKTKQKQKTKRNIQLISQFVLYGFPRR